MIRRLLPVLLALRLAACTGAVATDPRCQEVHVMALEADQMGREIGCTAAGTGWAGADGRCGEVNKIKGAWIETLGEIGCP